MKRNFIFSAIAGLSLIASSSAFASDTASTTPVRHQHNLRGAHGTYVCHEMPNLYRINQAVSKLHLTDEQRQKIRGILAAAAPRVRSDIQQMRANRQAIEQIMRTNYSDSSLNRLTRAQGGLYADLLKVKLQTIHQIHAVLTPEQINQLHAMKAKYRHKHHQS